MRVDIVYAENGEILSQVEIPSPPQVRIITPLAFRRLFTFLERMAIDNAVQGELTAEIWFTFRTMQKDFEAAVEINLDDPDIIDGVTFLQAFGWIDSGRAAEILAGTPPA